MEFVVSNRITVIDYNYYFYEWCVTNLVIDNPDYHKKVAMGKWVGNTPAKIFLFEKVGNELWLPFGCLRELWRMFPDKSKWRIDIRPYKPTYYKSRASLYPYQEKAITEALRAKNGILVMPCGSGKTQCGLEIIARLRGTALWLTHTQDLLNQSMNRAKGILEVNTRFGTITGGKVDISDSITFATVQTMAKLDLDKYKDSFDVIIVDECQRCAGSPTKITQFYKVISSLSARYKFGLTATPKRSDGLEKGMFALLGGIIHEVTKADVKDNTCPIEVHKCRTGYMPDYDKVLSGDGTIDYNALIDDMTHDYYRFTEVSKVINGLDGATLVLANRVEYLTWLKESYNKNAVCLSTLGTSKREKELRNDALRKLNEGEIDCIFATYQLAKEGLDVPNLRYLVLATPEKDETTIIQSVGRVGRKAEGKTIGTVIDMIDDFQMYKSWSKIRDKFYRKIEADIIDIT